MAKVIYSESALQDLERIIEFMLQSAPASAQGTLERIQTAIEILEIHPLIGRRIDGERRELIISAGATGYVAIYRYDAIFELIRILRIRHQREAGYRA
jgi:plasmid stabilization system protein ParE